MPAAKTRTWIVVADEKHARAFASVPGEHHLEPVAGFEFNTHVAAARDLMAERPGRVHESHGTTRHAIEYPSDPVRGAERKFARTIAEALHARLQAKEFDRLVLIAGPTMLGDLRDAVSDAVRHTVHKEFPKTLTHLTGNALEVWLRANEAI